MYPKMVSWRRVLFYLNLCRPTTPDFALLDVQFKIQEILNTHTLNLAPDRTWCVEMFLNKVRQPMEEKKDKGSIDANLPAQTHATA